MRLGWFEIPDPGHNPDTGWKCQSLDAFDGVILVNQFFKSSSISSVYKLQFTFTGNKSLGEVQYLSCQLAPTNGGDKSLEHTHVHSKPQQWVMALGIWQSPLSASTMGQKWVMTLCISHKTGPSKVEISLQKSFYLYDLLLQISVGLELFHWELDISYIQFTFVHTWLKGRVNVN